MLELTRLVEIEFQKFYANFFSEEANIFNTYWPESCGHSL
jgi:hypothetical protein